jgi:MFS family permease
MSRPTVPSDARRARAAVSALFLTNGALFANLIPRYPGIKADLALSNAAYGLAIIAFPTGAILAGLAAATLVRRFGSARLAVAGTVLTAVGVLVAGLAPSLPAFVVAMFLAGSMDSITDVAQNSHGLRVQRLYGRSIINGFHAIWSMGAVLGGAMAAGALALDLSRGVHLGVSAALFTAVALTALRFCLPGPDPSRAEDPAAAATGTASRTGRRVALTVAALVVIAVSGTLVEDAGATWAAVYLGGELGAAGTVAAAGFVALVGAQFVGRVVGDRMVDRFGQRAVARTGGAITAIGMGAALLWPSVPGTIAGFAAAGFGVATLVPAAMHAADELPGLRAGTGVTVVSWLMRLGFLVSPPVVGFVADTVSLRAGLAVVPLAGLLTLALASVLAGRAPGATRPADTAARATADA